MPRNIKVTEVRDASLRAKLNMNTEYLTDVSKGNITGESIVHKFGRNTAVANGAWELIGNLSAAYTFPAAATTVRVKAGGNAADDSAGAGARTIRVFGIDSNLNYADEAITLAGASASSSTSTSFWRVFRAFVETCGTYATPYNTGAIVVENTAGTSDLLKMEANESQTQLGLYSVATGYTAYLLSIAVQVDSTKPADIRLFTRENFNDTSAPLSASRLRHYADGIAGEYSYVPQSPMLSLAGPSDIWMEAEGSGGVSEVSCDFEMLLVQD